MNGIFAQLFAISRRFTAGIGNLVSTQELILSLSVLLAACGHHPGANNRHKPPIDHWHLVRGQGFLMSVPDRMSVHETRGVDFLLYSVQGLANNLVLRMYVGNFPSSEKLNQSVIDAFREKPSLTDTTVSWQSGSALRSREALIRLGSGTHYPRFLHVWYDSLSPRAAALDDSIIRTIVPDSTANGY